MTAATMERQRGAIRAILAWAALAAFETLAQLALKAGGMELGHRSFGVGWLTAAACNPWVIAGVAAYIGSFAAWMTILERMPLSHGFPLTAIVMVLVPLLSFVTFGESLTAWHTVGIALITFGTLLLGGGDT